MIGKKYKKLFAAIHIFFLIGCNSTPTPVATEPDLVGTRIAQAAEKAAKAMDAIAGIEQQRFPIVVADYSSAPPNMMQPITIRWSGPIEQIAETLAAKAGMQFRIVGKKPPVPVTVVVDVYEKPLIEVLRSIGLQAGQRADVSVDGQANVVEVRFSPADKLG